MQVKPGTRYWSNVAVGQVVGDAIAAGARMAVSAKNAIASFIEILSRVEIRAHGLPANIGYGEAFAKNRK